MQKGLIDLISAINVCPSKVVKLDISFCELNMDVDEMLCSQIESFRRLSYLNLSGNKLGEKVSNRQ